MLGHKEAGFCQLPCKPASTGLLILQVVEGMRRGLSPQAAAEDAVRRMVRKYPAYVGAVLAVDRHGRHAAACHGWTLTYAVRSAGMRAVQLFEVESLQLQAAGGDGLLSTA